MDAVHDLHQRREPVVQRLRHRRTGDQERSCDRPLLGKSRPWTSSVGCRRGQRNLDVRHLGCHDRGYPVSVAVVAKNGDGSTAYEIKIDITKINDASNKVAAPANVTGA